MKETHAYAAKCPKCGVIVGATVDDPDDRREVVRFTSALLAEGLDIERMAVAAVREAGWGPCRCADRAAGVAGDRPLMGPPGGDPGLTE